MSRDGPPFVRPSQAEMRQINHDIAENMRGEAQAYRKIRDDIGDRCKREYLEHREPIAEAFRTVWLILNDHLKALEEWLQKRDAAVTKREKKESK